LKFFVVGKIRNAQTFARGRKIRELARLNRTYGAAFWLKRRGVALVELSNGSLRWAEVHWYESRNSGRKELKIKRFLD